MCGIVGYTGNSMAAPVLLKGLQRLEYRGYDSAGIAVVNAGAIETAKASGKLINLCEKTDNGKTVSGLCGIGHTRWATHGAPTEANAHPHVSNNGKFAVVHNGIIENYAALRQELAEGGYFFHSETDTEVVVGLLEKYYQGDLKAAIIKTWNRLEGAFGLGIVCTDYPDTMVAMKNASPLVLGIGAGENFFASDVCAMIEHTKNVIYLEDGEFAMLTPESITVFDFSGRTVEKSVSRVTWSVEAAEKGGYEHFMLKEIMEQPGALRATIEPRVKNGEIYLDGVEFTAEDLAGIRSIMITACGSAYHAGCAGRYILEELTRIPVTVEVASELRYRNPLIDEHTLCIVISQSGETADTKEALKECKARGARTLAIVNVVGSAVAKLADDVLYTWAGPEIAVATTKGYTTQVLMLSLLAVYMGDKLGRITKERYDELLGGILALPERAQRALDLNANLPELAKKYYQKRSVFFIGRNVDYAVCLEGSLKLKEISYIHSEAYAAGELKHGTIALVENGSLMISLCCYEALFDKTVSNMVECKARGAEVLGVAHEGNHRILKEADSVIYVPETDPLLAPIPEVIPLQLLSYYIAKENNCDIDKPKNLAKSVTVE